MPARESRYPQLYSLLAAALIVPIGSDFLCISGKGIEN